LTLKWREDLSKIMGMFQTVAIIAVLATLVAIILAIRKQSKVTQELTPQERALNDKVFERSSQKMEANVAEALAEKARDPRLATMTQEDLVYEVLKDCYDPEIPLNVVDLGLICSVQVNRDSVDLKITMTSPQCPSHVSISEDIKTRLTDAGFPTPKIELVWEPAWSPQRISEAGRKALGI
jgi:metal-sulfur cluster biosynthetic enzyme